MPINTPVQALVLSLVLTNAASAQSLFRAPMPPPATPTQTPSSSNPPSTAPSTPPRATPPQATPTDQPAQPQPPAPALRPQAPTLEQVGIFVVQPIKPRQYQKHDKVEIIINESSSTKFEQKLDTKENASLRAELAQFPALEALLRSATLAPGIGSVRPSIAGSNNTNYKGEGTAERKDRFTARISGLVAEVKPNGLLLVEAKETITSDNESKSMVISGLIDPKDITNENTVQSAQMANLVIRVEHQGDTKDAATKGLLTRVFEGLFGP